MANNHTFEEQIRKLISETQDELNRIDEQLQSLQKQRADLAEELHS